MTVDKSQIQSNVITAVITAAALGILGFFMGVFEKGAEAINEDQIEAVLSRVLVTDSGETYGAALSSISTTQATILTEVGELKDEVDDLEDAVLELARD